MRMNKASLGFVLMLIGGVGMVTFVTATAADVPSQMSAYQLAARELSGVMEEIGDEAGARALASRLGAAVEKYNAAKAALTAELETLDLKNPEDGRLFEQTMKEIQTVNEGLTQHQLRLMSEPATSAVLADVIQKLKP